MKNGIKTYQFHTAATMKPYNEGKFWIDRNIVTAFEIPAGSLEFALEEYRGHVMDFGIEISNTALHKKRNLLYRDAPDGTPKKCGYIFTGKTLIADRSADYCGYQYIDLWVSIRTVKYFDAF